MSKRSRDRKTEPQDTLLGLLVAYEQLEPLLIQAEARGRRWAFDRAVADTHTGSCPSDQDIYDLHRVMFEPIFAWAGRPRTEERGPGGIVHVSWPYVRRELRQRFDDLAARTAYLVPAIEDVDVSSAAEVVAQAHHDFQYVHPFLDTNGRTGRVLDHYILWVTLELRSNTFETLPVLEYFPNDDLEDEYFDGLAEADAGYPDKLIRYFAGRIYSAIEVVE